MIDAHGIGRRRVRLALLALAVGACSDGPTALPPEGAIDIAAPWTVVSADAVGLDGNRLFVAGELAGRIERMRSLVVVRHGRIALERYYGGWTADTLADVRSVTKSVVSTLVGIALQEGRIEDIDQPITDFLRRPRYPVRVEHARVTIRDLLTMTGGFAWDEGRPDQYTEWILSDEHVAFLLDPALVATPGEVFTYNSAAVHLLGVVLEEAVGMTLPEYADRVLFGPIGIARRRWEDLGDGTVNGGAGLDLRPRDLARFGQLMLQRGWSGRRSVVPPEWVGEATTRRFVGLRPTPPLDRLSYGYLWWLDLDRGAYLAWGFGGQFVYVLPSADLVVVATTEWRGVREDIGPERLQQEVLDVIVHRVVPAVR